MGIRLRLIPSRSMAGNSSLIITRSNCTISAPRTSSLYRVDDPSHPIPEEIGYVPNRFRVRHKIPTSGRVSIIIEPAAENEVRGDAHECAVEGSQLNHVNDNPRTYIMINHVKKPIIGVSSFYQKGAWNSRI